MEGCEKILLYEYRKVVFIMKSCCFLSRDIFRFR